MWTTHVLKDTIPLGSKYYNNNNIDDVLFISFRNSNFYFIIFDIFYNYIVGVISTFFPGLQTYERLFNIYMHNIVYQRTIFLKNTLVLNTGYTK